MNSDAEQPAFDRRPRGTPCGHGYPASRTLVVEPQIAKDRKKSTTLMATMARRTARPDRDAHPGRAAGSGVAEVAVRQDDHHGEDEDLEEGPDHVARRQEQMEVVRIGAGRVVVVVDDDRVGREVGRQQPDDVERDDRDEAGDDAGGHQERQARHGHDLEGVDLLADAHGAELGGESAADGRRQRQAGHERRDLAGVEERGDEAGVGRDAELVQRGVALQADLGAGEEAT